MKHLLIGGAAVAAAITLPQTAAAQTEIQFWHAFTGRLGELVAEQVETFNAAQGDYAVVATTRATIPRRSTPASPRSAPASSRIS